MQTEENSTDVDTAKLLNTFSAGLSALATGGLSLGLEGAKLATTFVASAEITALALQTGEGRQVTQKLARNLRSFGLGHTASQMLAGTIASLGTSTVIGGALNWLGFTPPKTDIDYQIDHDALDALEVQIDSMYGRPGDAELILAADEDFGTAVGRAPGLTRKTFKFFAEEKFEAEVHAAKVKRSLQLPFGHTEKATIYYRDFGESKQFLGLAPQGKTYLYNPPYSVKTETIYGKGYNPNVKIPSPHGEWRRGQ